MTSNQHLYFCIDSTCDKIVDYYNAPCCLEHNPLVQGNEETLSHETSECPGCGNDMYCSANGYCSNCWAERFGCESTVSYDDHSCTNVFDHEVGQWTCGNADAHKCSGEWDYDSGILVCDFADEPDCPQHKCTNVFDYEVGQWTCGDHPPLPPSPSPTSDLEDQLSAITEKLDLGGAGMTSGQRADWEFLWHTTKSKLRAVNCTGCRDDVLNQQGHMDPGGCLFTPETQYA